jgi:hypothetical protein
MHAWRSKWQEGPRRRRGPTAAPGAPTVAICQPIFKAIINRPISVMRSSGGRVSENRADLTLGGPVATPEALASDRVRFA